MKTPIRNRREQQRDLPSPPCRADSLVRSVLGETKLFLAIGVHGGIAGRNIESARIDLRKVCEQLCSIRPFASDEGGEIAQQSSVGEMSERVLGHGRPRRGRVCGGNDSLVPRPFSALATRRKALQSNRLD